MISDLDIRRELRRIREERDQALADLADSNEVIDSMLLAPYRGMTAWAISLACGHRKHPTKPNGDTCYCGKREGGDRTDVT